MGGLQPYVRRRLQSGPFERTSKRRNGFPSESRVKRGQRVVHGDKELIEKLGRNDPCPCGSGRRFQAVLHAQWRLLTAPRAMTTSENSNPAPCQRAGSADLEDRPLVQRTSMPLFHSGDRRLESDTGDLWRSGETGR